MYNAYLNRILNLILDTNIYFVMLILIQLIIYVYNCCAAVFKNHLYIDNSFIEAYREYHLNFSRHFLLSILLPLGLQ